MTISDMKKSVETRFRGYIQKIAAGPRQSKDLAREEAEDAFTLILNGEVSPLRAAVFLIAARMKRESLEENLGYWKALDDSTMKQLVKVRKLLQVSDPFDGFNRTPCFTFYAIPVIANLGLPCYGHSACGLPPKFGITFQEILEKHYQVSPKVPANTRFLEEKGFCFVNLRYTHPKLEALRALRTEMVKRSALATFEKMLMPLQADGGESVLATTYFHRGYEEPMIAAARISEFDTTIIGNGLESTTLFGVHKAADVFIVSGKTDLEQRRIDVSDLLLEKEAERVCKAYSELKTKQSNLADLTSLGEQALKNGSGPATPIIAWQAGSLAYLSNEFSSFQESFEAAEVILKSGVSYRHLKEFINYSRS